MTKETHFGLLLQQKMKQQQGGEYKEKISRKRFKTPGH